MFINPNEDPVEDLADKICRSNYVKALFISHPLWLNMSIVPDLQRHYPDISFEVAESLYSFEINDTSLSRKSKKSRGTIDLPALLIIFRHPDPPNLLLYGHVEGKCIQELLEKIAKNKRKIE